jgi:DNA-binding GntR family transcriptional regulator
MVAGDLRPGVIYSASAIAEDLGVTVSPARHALLTLVSEGLVEPVRNRGFRIIEIDEHGHREIAALRVLVEIPATVRLAGHPEIIKRHNEFRAIAAETVDAARSGDLAAFYEADRRFHLGVLAYAGNERLVDLITMLRNQMRLVEPRDRRCRAELISSADEHHRLLEAIVDGDAQAVESMMAAHLDHADVLPRDNGRPPTQSQ